MQNKFSVVVLEDELTTRERLVRVITNSTQFTCLAACETLGAGRRALDEFTPDILLLDIDLPDGNGLELISYLEGEKAKTKPVVVTVFEDSRHVMEAISVGAAGYVLKDDPSISIEQALLMILEGGAPISPAIARQILLKFKDTQVTSDDAIDGLTPDIEENDPEEHKKIESLTPREREILVMVSDGFTDKEIAREKNISYYTVTTHVKRIYQKLSVKTRVEAARQAIKHGIIEQT